MKLFEYRFDGISCKPFDITELTKDKVLVSITKFIKISKLLSEGSYCQRHKVGAILVKYNQIISDGINGTVPGFKNECESAEDSSTNEYVTLHAEENVFIKLLRNGTSSITNSELFVTLSPCLRCARLIASLGISSIYFLEEYRDPEPINILVKAGVHVYRVVLD